MNEDMETLRKNCKNIFSRRPLYNIDKSTQARFRYIVARSGTRLERTSPSTGGSIVPAYDIVYIVQLLYGNEDFSIAAIDAGVERCISKILLVDCTKCSRSALHRNM